MSKTARKPFEIERDLADAKAAYHEASQIETVGQLQSRSDAIKALGNELNDVYTEGAVERPEGVKPLGMKKARGLYEVGNMQGLRSRGETPEEAIANWNDGLYVFTDGPGVTVGKAETAEATA